MNFFEHQDRAKRKTKQLIFLLFLAVISLVAITTFFLAVFIYFTQSGNTAAQSQHHHMWQGILHAFSPEAFFWITLTIISVVCCGSIFRFLQLQGGGRTVAEAMGGRLLNGKTQNVDERKILNVVEEIAIASGTAVPPVYVIDDEAINAFAAGYKPQDAVIGVTRGCIQQLSRDELQGVIAHEFSHIFHGDMRLNMRLVALLYGILIIGLIGAFLVRHSSNRSIVRSGKDKSPVAIIALGVGLWVIGYTGTFFGNIIKAAVSRQREFLADASAVQFTRNPEGIAGALKKIGGNISGSELRNEQATEFSHMYFGQGVKVFLTMMATHPPLEERIRRIQPDWNGEFTSAIYTSPSSADSGFSSSTSAAENISTNHATTNDMAMGFSTIKNNNAGSHTSAYTAIDMDATLAQIAQPTTDQIDNARLRLNEIPTAIKVATTQPFSARAVVFGLLLDRHTELRAQQLHLLSTLIAADELESLQPIIKATAVLSSQLRLPLIELCISALKELSPNQHQQFIAALELLINADNKVSLMEWALYRIVQHNLCATTKSLRNRALKDLHNECQLLLSLIAYAGATTEMEAKAAFDQAATLLPFTNLTLLARHNIKLTAADTALEQLNLVKPLQKPQLLKAINRCIYYDNKVSIAEAELFRAIADSLDCPIPLNIPRTNN